MGKRQSIHVWADIMAQHILGNWSSIKWERYANLLQNEIHNIIEDLDQDDELWFQQHDNSLIREYLHSAFPELCNCNTYSVTSAVCKVFLPSIRSVQAFSCVSLEMRLTWLTCFYHTFVYCTVPY